MSLSRIKYKIRVFKRIFIITRISHPWMYSNVNSNKFHKINDKSLNHTSMTSSRISIKEVKPKNLASSKTPSKKQKNTHYPYSWKQFMYKNPLLLQKSCIVRWPPIGCVSPSIFMYCDRQTDNVPSGLMSLSSTSCPCRR